MKELRNIIDEENFVRLQNEVFSASMPWYLSGTYASIQYTDLVNINSNENQHFSFAHLVYMDGDIKSELYHPLSKIIFNGLEQMGETPTKLLRIKVNMCTCQPEMHIHQPHVDYDEPQTSGLIYINTTNGPTTIYNEKFDPRFGLTPQQYLLKILNNKITIKEQIECEANKMVIFDGKHYHSSSAQSDTYRRIVVNFNYR